MNLILLSFFLLVEVLTLFFTAPDVFAHAGGGPPFVLVNNRYAATNPLFQGAPTEKGLNIPQDLSPEVYLVNSPIHLKVDLQQLGVDPTLNTAIHFTWSFTSGPNLDLPVESKVSGQEIDKTFHRIGSYLVSLTSQVEGQDELLLDTILIHIVPDTSYALPQSSVEVLSNLKSGSISTFTNTANGVERTYLWDFGDNDTVKGARIEKRFTQEYFYSPVYSRVIDSKGFIHDIGLVVVGDKGKLSFSLINPNDDAKLLIVKAPPSQTKSILFVFLVIFIIGLVVFLLLRSKKNIIHT